MPPVNTRYCRFVINPCGPNAECRLCNRFACSQPAPDCCRSAASGAARLVSARARYRCVTAA